MTGCLLLEQLLEILQVACVDVRHCPVSEVAVSPMEQVIALAFHHLLRFAIRGGCRPNKQINEMFALLVNEGCHGMVIEIIKAATDQGKALAGEIHDRGCKIELFIEPWLDSVLVL